MDAISDIVLASLLCAAVLIFIRAVKITVSVPVRTGKNTEMLIVLKVRGDDKALEHTVKGISEITNAGIVIVDCGMTEETRRRGEILSRGKYNAQLITKQDLTESIGAEYER